MTTDTFETEMRLALAMKLLDTFHLNVAERQDLGGERVLVSELLAAAGRALEASPFLPAKRRPGDSFDGVILERRGTDYWTHERHEIGVARYSDVRSRRARDLADALRAYLKPFGGNIDGVAIVDDSSHPGWSWQRVWRFLR